jgi:SOS response regulatory protein OraA/RecX
MDNLDKAFDKNYAERQIKKYTEQLAEAERHEQNEKLAERLHDLFQSLVNKGFSEEQAFYIFYEMVKSAWGNS